MILAPTARYDATLMACDQENSRREDCDPADIYSIMTPCITAMLDPANFCSSPCHVTLRPWVDQCLGGEDEGIQQLVQPIVALLDTCPPPPPVGELEAPLDKGRAIILHHHELCFPYRDSPYKREWSEAQ